MPAIVKSFIKGIGLITAVVIISAAVLVCISRLLTPALNDHRADIENMASELLHTPVTISKVQATWYQYQPEVRLENVTVLDAQTHQPVMQIKNVDVFISLPKSLIERRFVVTGVMISGTSLNINKDAAGNISLQGFSQFDNQDKPFQSTTKLTDALAWLTQEQKIILTDIDLHYSGFHNESRFVTLHSLNLGNSGKTHTVSGTATLHQKLPTKIKFALQVQGTSLDINTINADGYVYVSGLDLGQWLPNEQWHGWKIMHGIASNKIWFSWDKGQIQKLQTITQAYGVQLNSSFDNSTHIINRISGNFGWSRDDSGNQTFVGDDILIDLPGHFWPATSFSYATQSRVLKVGYIDLADLSKYLLSDKDLTAEQSSKIKQLQLRGGLTDTSITLPQTFNDWKKIPVATTFSQLSAEQVNGLPAYNNVAGNLNWDGSKGQLNLNSKNIIIQDDSYNSNPMMFTDLNGSIAVKNINGNFQLNLNKLQLSNQDINSSLSGTINLNVDSSPVVNLQDDFAIPHLERIANYLPIKLFDKELAGWLTSAFKSGDAQSGHAVLQGSLNDFPFDDGKGVLSVNTVVNNAAIEFAPDWPGITNINAKLGFSKRKITIDTDSATSLNIPLGKVHVEIAGLGGDKPSVLNASDDVIDTSFERGFAYVNQSPLKTSLGKMFEGVDLAGAIKMKLGLAIPLSDPEATKVNGAISMSDANMNLGKWSLNIGHMNGDLQFTEDSVTANQISAELFNKLLTFNLVTTKDKDGSSVVANYNTALAVSDLRKWLQIPLIAPIQGSTNVNGKINFSMNHPFALELQSDLVGVNIDVDNQFQKSAQQSKKFDMKLNVSAQQPLKLILNYGDEVSAALVLNQMNGNYQLTAADIHVGNGPADWPDANGLYLTGSFDTIDWAQIQNYLQSNNESSNSAFSNLALQGVDIQAKHLKIAGYDLQNIKIIASPEKTEWLVNIASPDIVGELDIPKTFTAGQTLVANFSKLNIPTLNSQTVENSLVIKNLPSIVFNSKNTTYAGKFLGQLYLSTTPAANGLTIKTLNMLSSNINLKASGSWVQNGNSNSTQLAGAAVSTEVDKLLASLGYDDKTIIVKNGKVNFNLNWDDTPYNFTVDNAGGTLSLSLGKGRIAEIGKDTNAKMDLGRMLSIFSLQTIPRRLSLDFSDVFEKGYSFDKVTGDFTFKNGSLYTHDFNLDGPVAKVGINGRIGIVDKDYDFTLIVTPYITSSIPVAALMLGQPLIGLAAFAVNNVIGSSIISKAATYYYAVSGHWANPVWKSISASASKFKV